ncbi:hypothetical protein CUMW_141190 [Citrus unshiu]|nr:hypothetical protein CUMW_141190 [Citrus unshiu]
MERRRRLLLPFSVASVLILLLLDSSSAQMPGFVSLNCGANENFTDEIGLQWIADDHLIYGEISNISVANETRKQYMTLRHFPADSRKYCYKLDVITRTRYLIRATFLYGNFDNNNVYPKFDISLGPTHWSTIVISDAATIEVRELIFLASSPKIDVCLSNATTGQPFISTLELRQFNGSVYLTPFEDHYYLSVSARINFGADSEAPVRYPDDPFDRIWESDSLKKANYLVDVAAGTEKVLVLPGQPDVSKAIVNIQENAQGKYRVYEPGYTNLSLPFVLSFKFGKTYDSSRGPLLNAMEINKYLERNDGSIDGVAIVSVISLYSSADWAQEGGDPCLPVPWSWLQCNSDPQPSITVIHLSSKNLTGNIPSDLTKLSSLVELWLDGNSLTGPIPDFSGCPDLRIIHLEDNQLTGPLPSSLMNLPNLRELYVQNNMLSGTVPSSLLSKNVVLNYAGNINLHEGGRGAKHLNIIIGSSVGAAVLLLATVVSCLFMHKGKKNNYDKEQHRHSLPVQRPVSSLNDAPAEAAHCFTLSDIEDATKMLEKKIGSGGFGVVYYGKLKDGKEIAVKVLTSNSYQGKREFTNEVTLLSRIHHRNLVQFLGYCQEEGRSVLVYEFMHNGTLKEHLYGTLTHEQRINWIKRLEIAEDAAKGIEYLHTGCVPAIIHRDLKSSNILLDKHMRAKVSDFGLSKFAVDGASHVSSIVRGTVGYLDPEYYISQQLTDKSDVYSFGVILLELISGQEAISNEKFGANCRNIVQWAKLHIESGDIQGIIDPSLLDEYDIQSMWKIAEKALMCVLPHGHMRPSISEVLKDIQDAIVIEREAAAARDGNSDDMSRNSLHSSLNVGSFGGTENFLSLDESIVRPSAR